MAAEHDDLLRRLIAWQIAHDVPGNHWGAFVGAGEADFDLAVPFEQALQKGAIFQGDGYAGDERLAIIANASSGRTKTWVMIDEDETGGSGDNGTAVFFHAVYPTFAAFWPGFTGRQDDPATDFVGAGFKIVWRAFTHVDERAF